MRDIGTTGEEVHPYVAVKLVFIIRIILGEVEAEGRHLGRIKHAVGTEEHVVHLTDRFRLEKQHSKQEQKLKQNVELFVVRHHWLGLHRIRPSHRSCPEKAPKRAKHYFLSEIPEQNIISVTVGVRLMLVCELLWVNTVNFGKKFCASFSVHRDVFTHVDEVPRPRGPLLRRGKRHLRGPQL